MKLPFVLLTVCVVTSPLHGREWTDSTGKFSVEGELVWHDEKSVVLEKPDGSRVHIDMPLLSKKDAAFLSSLKNEQPAGPKPAPPRPRENDRAGRSRKASQNQEFTAFGEVKLDRNEIDLFIQQCREKKPGIIEDLQRDVNRRAEDATPARRTAK